MPDYALRWMKPFRTAPTANCFSRFVMNRPAMKQPATVIKYRTSHIAFCLAKHEKVMP